MYVTLSCETVEPIEIFLSTTVLDREGFWQKIFRIIIVRPLQSCKKMWISVDGIDANFNLGHQLYSFQIFDVLLKYT